MKRKIIYGIFIITFITFLSKKVVNQEIPVNLLQLNIEALARVEVLPGKAAEKNSSSTQNGPFFIIEKGKEVIAYEVITVTNCFGLGVIDCEPGISRTIVIPE